VLEIDCNLPLRSLTGEEIRWLAKLAPFGIGNPAPMFLARDVVVDEARWVGNGDKHRRLRLRDGRVTWTALAFDMGEIAVTEGDRIDVVYTIECGAPEVPVELRVEDMRPSQALT
jgi:single-stranded-DNA-specific exonuclease